MFQKNVVRASLGGGGVKRQGEGKRATGLSQWLNKLPPTSQHKGALNWSS